MRNRSITTLTREHVGLLIRVSELSQVRTGQLTAIAAAETHSPNAHPRSWTVEIDGVPYQYSAAASWTRLKKPHTTTILADAAKDAGIDVALTAVPGLVVRSARALFRFLNI